MEVRYISFSFHLFKVKFRVNLLSYVIYPFFISMHVHDQPETSSAISSDENNINKHTTFCDVRKLLKSVPSVDVLIALVTSAFVIAVTKFEGEGFIRNS